MAGAMDSFSWCHRLDLICFAAKLSLAGVTCRGYAAACTGLRTIADRHGYRASGQAPSHTVTLYRPAHSWTAFLGCANPQDGQSTLVLTAQVPDGLNLL
jgi:hypothetical protein